MSGFIGLASGALGAAGGISSALNNLVSLLRPASWRGVPFGVTQYSISPGRQTAVHAYPYRDGQWVEDLGRGPRPFRVSGFLLANDVRTFQGSLDSQRAAMVAACEGKGPGVLVHPALGAKTVSLIGGCEMSERWDQGGLIELSFEFLETLPGPRFPTTNVSTSSPVTTNSASLGTKSIADFAADILGPVQAGASVVQQGVSTVTSFADMALSAVGGARLILAATTGLVGNFGRYANGRVSVQQPTTATTASLLAASVSARTAVRTGGTTAVASAGSL